MRLELRPLGRRSPARFLPPLLWMALIALGSSSILSGDRTGPWMRAVLGHLAPGMAAATLDVIHIGFRKLGHVIEFGILAVLWYRALAPAPRAAWVAFILAAAYGGVDELRQGLEPSRSPALTDVGVDALGAWLALAAWTEPGRGAWFLRGAAWGTGLLAGLSVLGLVLDSTLRRPATDVAIGAIGLGLVAASLARLARRAAMRASSGPRLPLPP